MMFFKYCKKSVHGTVLNFAWNHSSMNASNQLKLFFGEKSCTGVFGQKGPKMSFLSFETNWCIKCFAWNCFDKILSLEFFWQKPQKLAEDEDFYLLWGWEAWHVYNFCIELHQDKGLKLL